MKAESTAPVTMMTKIIVISRLPPMRITCLPMMSAIPVRVRPSLRMNIAQTVMTALLLKPAKACEESTRPVTASAPRTRSATRSMRMTSLMNRTSEIARMPRTSAISRVMQDLYTTYCYVQPRVKACKFIQYWIKIQNIFEV